MNEKTLNRILIVFSIVFAVTFGMAYVLSHLAFREFLKGIYLIQTLGIIAIITFFFVLLFIQFYGIYMSIS